ncbi:hypothetical protein WI41_07070 [Burkholderia latens]|uniref:Uncharacterized protein n=1 Tax=Burkholderia latens TaxID=488446 RepID=A0AAP1GBZ9_9BURK|nr:hypothetical protein [Burkholderia latens]KVA11848.1 hypothetical protein WI41_07070 [Burkholderia latens]
MNLPVEVMPSSVGNTTSHGVILPVGTALEPFDRIVRISTDLLTQSLVTQWCETDELQRVVFDWAQAKQHEVDLLKSFAAWQKKKLDYQAVYNAYILEAISEEEFEEESTPYVVEIKEVDPLMVGRTMDELVELLPFEVSTSDFADYFECEPEDVVLAIAAGSRNEKLLSLLPHDAAYKDD